MLSFNFALRLYAIIDLSHSWWVHSEVWSHVPRTVTFYNTLTKKNEQNQAQNRRTAFKKAKRSRAPDPGRNQGFAGDRRGTLYILDENSQLIVQNGERNPNLSIPQQPWHCSPMEAATGAGRASGAGLQCWLWEHHHCTQVGPEPSYTFGFSFRLPFREERTEKTRKAQGCSASQIQM